MKDVGRMTFCHDLILSGLLALEKSKELTKRMMSGQEDTCQSAAGIGNGLLSCFQ